MNNIVRAYNKDKSKFTPEVNALLKRVRDFVVKYPKTELNLSEEQRKTLDDNIRAFSNCEGIELIKYYAMKIEDLAKKYRIYRDVGVRLGIDYRTNDNNPVDKMNKDVLRSIVDGELKRFSLKEFMEGNSLSNSAAALITSDGNHLTADCGILKTTEHGNVIDIFYKLLGKDINLLPPWQIHVIWQDDIAIQFCYGSPTLMWLPKECSEFQIEELQKLNEEIKAIYESNPTFFEETPMEFNFQIGSNPTIEGECKNTLETLIKEICKSITVKTDTKSLS